MGRPHPFHRPVGSHASGQVKTVIRRFEGAGAGPLPLMSITEALADGPANFHGLPSPHPDHRIGAGDVGELELVDTDPGLPRLLTGRIIQGGHILAPANLGEGDIFVIYVEFGQLFPALRRC